MLAVLRSGDCFNAQRPFSKVAHPLPLTLSLDHLHSTARSLLDSARKRSLKSAPSQKESRRRREIASKRSVTPDFRSATRQELPRRPIALRSMTPSSMAPLSSAPLLNPLSHPLLWRDSGVALSSLGAKAAPPPTPPTPDPLLSGVRRPASVQALRSTVGRVGEEWNKASLPKDVKPPTTGVPVRRFPSVPLLNPSSGERALQLPRIHLQTR